MTHHQNQPSRILLRTGLPALLLTLLLIGLPSLTLACSCAESPWPPRGLEKYSTVFLGTVTEAMEEEYEDPEITERRKRAPEIPAMKYRRLKGIFSVEKMWKGNPVKKLNYVSTRVCPALLTKGEQYLIYASPKDGSMILSMCTPYKKAKNLEVEMMFLDWTFAGLSREEIIDRLAGILLDHEEERFRIQTVPLLANGDLRIDPQKTESEYWGALLAEGGRGIRSKKVESAFWKAMKDPSVNVRVKVVKRIFEVLTRTDALRAFLVQSFKDPSLRVRLASIYLLRYPRAEDLGEKRWELIRILKKDLSMEEKKLTNGDSEDNVKHHRAIQRVIKGLMMLQGEEENKAFLPRVLKGLSHEDYWVRSYASSNLHAMKGLGREILPELKALLEANPHDDARKDINEIISTSEKAQKN